VPAFSKDFRAELATLMRWRRDVRSFLGTPVDEALLAECLESFHDAPSVGLSEPWRIVRVASPEGRAAALENFRAANAAALDAYGPDRAGLYARLKLSGMREAPVHLAVCCAEGTRQGHSLGVRTMPETRRYSVVAAITHFWLVARAHGLGVGWVSILQPDRLARDLDLPSDWALVAYLCVGWPAEEQEDPELQRTGWERRRADLTVLVR
jgi:5,6-dimethylbenzimidazole synthase